MNEITDEKLLELTGELYDIAFAAGRDEEPNYKRVNEIDAELKDLITSQKAICVKEADKYKQVAAQLDEALRLTQEYVGKDVLPDIEGWSHYDARQAYAQLSTEDVKDE